jgi:hypothetical protein
MLQISSHKPGMIRPFLTSTRRRGNEPFNASAAPMDRRRAKEKLDDLMEAGKTAAEIATALQRTPPSIYSRLQRLYRKQPKPGRRLVELGLKVKGK